MRSWLSSPGVALMEFAVAVLALVQAAARAARSVVRVAADEASPVPVASAVVALVAAAGAAALTWPAMEAWPGWVTGTGGLTGRLWPGQCGVVAVGAALWLLRDARRRERPELAMAVCGAAGLVVSGLVYALPQAGQWWGAAVAFGGAAVLVAAYVPVLVAARAAERASA
jgi:hypothetical protein